MAQKMLTLTEAFRTVLRARYATRPPLADEIQAYRYFHSARWCHCGSRRIDPEAQAADEALDVLNAAIASQSVRLHGRLGDNLPADINPTEVIRTGINVFDNALDVWEPSTRSNPYRNLRTYRNVHCYEEEIEALISPAPVQAEQPRRLTKKSRGDYVAAYIKDNVNPTIDGLGNHAINDGIVGGRELLRKEFRIQWAARGHVVGKRGRRETRAN